MVKGVAALKLVSSCLAEEVLSSNLGPVTLILEIVFLLLPSQDMTEMLLK